MKDSQTANFLYQQMLFFEIKINFPYVFLFGHYKITINLK
jgi:hypothetical protein